MGSETDIGEAGGSDRVFSRRSLIKGGAIVGGTLWVAPVVESFTSKAWAASVAHYCCSCWDLQPPISSLAQPHLGVSDGHPSSLGACVAFCSGTTAANSDQYQSFAWTGARLVPLTYSGGGLGGGEPGCYLSTGAAETGCSTGTIPYSGGVPGVPTLGTFGSACTHA